MQMAGNEIYVQRGETFSLDFAVRNAKGDPYMVFKGWKNPYLAITISTSLYAQEGSTCEMHWLDLDQCWVENADGSATLKPMKRFISTEALYLSMFDVDDARHLYGEKISLSPDSDFYIGNYLFYTDDGIRVYKYFDGYDTDNNEIWVEYDFRIIKSFDTTDWSSTDYLYDVKIIAGESVIEKIQSLSGVTISTENLNDIESALNLIESDEIRAELYELYISGVPLLPTYDVKSVILEPTPIYVSSNISRRC